MYILIKLNNHLADTKVNVPFTKPNARSAYKEKSLFKEYIWCLISSPSDERH